LEHAFLVGVILLLVCDLLIFQPLFTPVIKIFQRGTSLSKNFIFLMLGRIIERGRALRKVLPVWFGVQVR
jgi:hypothetical protein